MKRVVITGMGALTPVGNTLQDHWNGVVSGKSGAGPITKFDATNFKTRFACEVKNFDALQFMDKREAGRMDLYCQYALAVAGECMADTGMNLDTVDTNRVGVIWSSGIGGLATLEEQISAFVTGGGVPKFSPFFIPKMISDMGAGLISIRYGFRGVNFCTVSACASSTHGMIDAFNYIRLGKANAVLTGGSEAVITFSAVGGFNAMRALSERNDSPETASRPFDSTRDGFVLGEGAGALMLEELEHALNRGAKIYCEVVGGGATADAFHITATHPEGLGAMLAMEEALREANLSPADVDYINMHATSTPVGDPAETSAIVKMFGNHLDKLHVSATKSMTGHLLGAAGAIEAVTSALAIHHNTIPPTINLVNRDETIHPDLNVTANVAVQKPVNVAMSNTFGFGGHNAIVALKRFEE